MQAARGRSVTMSDLLPQQLQAGVDGLVHVQQGKMDDVTRELHEPAGRVVRDP